MMQAFSTVFGTKTYTFHFEDDLTGMVFVNVAEQYNTAVSVPLALTASGGVILPGPVMAAFIAHLMTALSNQAKTEATP